MRTRIYSRVMLNKNMENRPLKFNVKFIKMRT